MHKYFTSKVSLTSRNFAFDVFNHTHIHVAVSLASINLNKYTNEEREDGWLDFDVTITDNSKLGLAVNQGPNGNVFIEKKNYNDNHTHFLMNHNLNVVQAYDRILALNGVSLNNCLGVKSMLLNIKSPFKLTIRRLKRHCKISITYIFDYNPGSSASLSLSMSPSIKREIYVTRINEAH